MVQGESLFSYKYKNSLIHKLPSAMKLLSMIAISVLAFLGGTEIRIFISLIICVSFFLARISITVLLHSLKILILYGLIMFLFRFTGFTTNRALLLNHIFDSLIYLWQLSLVLFSGTIFFETTSSLEIRNTLQFIQEKCYTIFGNPKFLPDIAFLLSLTITFIPRIFEVWSNLDRSWNARGGNLHSWFKKSWLKLTIVIPLLIEHLLSLASETERAIRNRS